MLHLMLPVQYLRRADMRLAEPQKRLMVAVLQSVLDDWQEAPERQPPGRGLARDRRAYLEAKAYVASPDRSWPFSFENICEAVGLDAERIRRQLDAERSATRGS